MTGAITFRSIRPDDEEFLREVYASTRLEELALLNWTEAEKAAFLRMQFDAQLRHYQTHFAGADFLIIEREGQRVGRLYLARLPDEIRIVDITLLPQYRDGGIGTRLLKNILTEASAAAKPVRIHVERSNPALRLYRRLGFTVIADQPIHLLLEKPALRQAPGITAL